MKNNRNLSDSPVYSVTPSNYGWLEKKLSKEQIEYLWKCVENERESHKQFLAGHINQSNVLIDENEWFFKNVLLELCVLYSEKFGNLGDMIPTTFKHPYILSRFWVNHQKQHEFNPIHSHNAIYSFVVWMKIPTKHDEQNSNPIAAESNTKLASVFQFVYTDILGKITTHDYKMNPETEGTLVFFPASLPHLVYPFYNCDDDRVSISGNIAMDTSKFFD